MIASEKSHQNPSVFIQKRFGLKKKGIIFSGKLRNSGNYIYIYDYAHSFFRKKLPFKIGKKPFKNRSINAVKKTFKNCLKKTVLKNYRLKTIVTGNISP